MKTSKTFPIPLRMEQWVVTEAETISKKTGLDRSDILRLILAAGVKAIVDNNYEISFPLILDVRQRPAEQGPPPKKKKTSANPGESEPPVSPHRGRKASTAAA